ncbi:DUF1798 family protein [Bacillus tuaregi]|uniref:DUF1798 family protein n=1 Tax=Bacillus tuaregi TaxID=1816695 RepID=UPI0008F8B0B2|nr:DUF1798 family protein [Bacillus tuaregi]
MTQGLFSKTETLLGFCQQVMGIFVEAKKSNQAADFHHEVLPFANKLKEELESWYPLAKGWIVSVQPRNLHLEQLDSVIQQLEILAVQAFFPQTSMTRFHHMMHSVEFVLKGILNELHDDYV